MNKKGFTLSEVLITLGVIGIVAVLTIPGVMKNYQNRLYTAQLEKIYAQISDATQSIMNDQHVDNFSETTAVRMPAILDSAGNCNGGMCDFLNKYFKTVKKNCRNNTAEACLSTKSGVYKTIGGTTISAPASGYFVQTITGAAIGARLTTGTPRKLQLIVDINGLAEPNTIGRDVFSIEVRENGTLTDVDDAKGDICTKGGTALMYTAPQGCLNRIIEDGWKMEYQEDKDE